jgi:hypothetical protein
MTASEVANIEVVRRYYSGCNSGDLDELLAAAWSFEARSPFRGIGDTQLLPPPAEKQSLSTTLRWYISETLRGSGSNTCNRSARY